MVRVQPELADHEHLYYAALHSGGDERFDEEYEQAHERYFPRLHREEGMVVDPGLPMDPADAPETEAEE